MQVRDLLEGALYLSVKDKFFNALPEIQIERDAILLPYMKDLNQILIGVGKKNPGLNHASVRPDQLLVDPKLNMTFVDLSQNPFLTIFRVEFLYSGGTTSISLQRLGLNDFFGNSSIRTVNTFPAWYNYNVFSKRLYIYPSPSIDGLLNIFGKRKIGPFESLDEEFPFEISDTFEVYLQYYFAKFLCSIFNAPWQAQKEELLQNYKKLLDSENNISYQSLSLQESTFSLPIRNTRIGL